MHYWGEKNVKGVSSTMILYIAANGVLSNLSELVLQGDNNVSEELEMKYEI